MTSRLCFNEEAESQQPSAPTTVTTAAAAEPFQKRGISEWRDFAKPNLAMSNHSTHCTAGVLKSIPLGTNVRS